MTTRNTSETIQRPNHELQGSTGRLDDRHERTILRQWRQELTQTRQQLRDMNALNETLVNDLEALRRRLNELDVENGELRVENRQHTPT